MTPYTVYKYWWVDSMAKQTIALLDKSGLRKKGTVPPDPDKPEFNPEMPDNEFVDMLIGFGFQPTAKEETQEEKADRIRNELNKTV